MTIEINAIQMFPDSPDSLQTVLLGGITCQIRLLYRERLRGWYMDVYDNDGAALLLGVRLNPGVARSIIGVCTFIVGGSRNQEQEDAGETLALFALEGPELWL